jgi:hypothetical protein
MLKICAISRVLIMAAVAAVALPTSAGPVYVLESATIWRQAIAICCLV